VLDILAFSESKLDDTFPNSQFSIANFNMYRADRTSHGGGVMCYVRSTLPHRIRSDISHCNDTIENLVVEVKQKSNKYFFIIVYSSPSTPFTVFNETLSCLIEKCLSESDTIYIMGDININLLQKKNKLHELLACFGLSNTVKGATCFKNINNPSLLDVILCTKPKTIVETLNINIGISDFHNFICAAAKIEVPNIDKIRIQYRSYKKFNEHLFKFDLSNQLSNINTSVCEINECNNDKIMETVMQTIQNTLNKHAPTKVKYIKPYQVPYMNSKLRKAINVKNMLFRKHIKCPNDNTWEEYKRHRNYVTSLKKTSLRNYFEINCKQGGKNKFFWEIIKPYFSNKTYMSSKINLLENGCLVTDTGDVCEIFNDFFVNIVSADTSSNISHRADFTNHESIKAIRLAYPSNNPFQFRAVSEDEVLKKLFKLNTRKAQGYDKIPPYVLKVAAQEICQLITKIINNAFICCSFPNVLKYADVSPILKKIGYITEK
jgi:hypothetical protein